MSLCRIKNFLGIIYAISSHISHNFAQLQQFLLCYSRNNVVKLKLEYQGHHKTIWKSLGVSNLWIVYKDSGKWLRLILTIYQFQDHRLNPSLIKWGILYSIYLSVYEAGFLLEIDNRVVL